MCASRLLSFSLNASPIMPIYDAALFVDGDDHADNDDGDDDDDGDVDDNNDADPAADNDDCHCS